MTALKEFQRLEATGLWRAEAGAQRREVIVSLGDATLTIGTSSGEILTHWSLGAITRANGAQVPAIYHPDIAPEETLELGEEEAEFISGLDRVLRAIDRRRPRPGKLRFLLSGSVAAALVAGAVFWLPDALERYATRVVPPVKRTEIGNSLLTHLTRLTGRPCMTPDAQGPLERFAQRIEGAGRVIILPGGSFSSAHLPGGIVLLNRSVLEDFEDPDVAAGFVLAETTSAALADPLAELLDAAGVVASLRLLTTGNLPSETLAAYAQHLLTNPAPRPDEAALLRAFDAADLRSTPYAYAVDITGESTLTLIEADPHRSDGSRIVLSDGDWVRLQGICGA